MKKMLMVLNAIAIALLAIIPFVREYKDSDYLIVQKMTTFLDANKLSLIAVAGVFVFLYTLLPNWVRPRKEKKKLLQRLLTRIGEELLEGDENENRITLFKEISWGRAICRNYYYLLRHIFWTPQKCKLYLKFPKKGRYLIVYLRCGRRFKKSSTMLRIDNNKERRCEGIAGVIAFKGVSTHIYNLPDISDIGLLEYKTVGDIGSSRRKRVKEYMENGHISDFNLLKKIHKPAIHFYGTIINAENGKQWGVVLADSSVKSNVFAKKEKERFDSFALTISDVIQLEV